MCGGDGNGLISLIISKTAAFILSHASSSASTSRHDPPTNTLRNSKCTDVAQCFCSVSAQFHLTFLTISSLFPRFSHILLSFPSRFGRLVVESLRPFSFFSPFSSSSNFIFFHFHIRLLPFSSSSTVIFFFFLCWFLLGGLFVLLYISFSFSSCALFLSLLYNPSLVFFLS